MALLAGSALIAGGTSLAYRAQVTEPGREPDMKASTTAAQDLIVIVLAMINYTQVGSENRFPPAAIPARTESRS